MINFLPSVILYLVELLLLAGIVLALHRSSTWLGLAPLYVFLGGLLIVLQFRLLGVAQFEVGWGIIEFSIGSYLILPGVVLGVLIVYVVNGTGTARSLMAGLVGVTLFIAVYKWLQLNQPLEPFFQSATGLGLAPTNPRVVVSSGAALASDFLVLVIVYQGLSNLRKKHPSRLAGLVALLSALWVDALVFPILMYAGSPGWWLNIPFHLMGKSVAGLTLVLVLFPYLNRIAPVIPDSAAAIPRPTLNIFERVTQSEARARYHYSLLHTLSQIGQLIVRSTDQNLMLQQACEALLKIRSYHKVWIGILDPQTKQLRFSAQAGFLPDQLEFFSQNSQMLHVHSATLDEKMMIVRNTARQKQYGSAWRQMMSVTGCRAAAIFPMRFAGRVLGSLNVCLGHADFSDQLEIDMLQELADDLAYALMNLETRAQQALLLTAAGTMQDGIIITDFEGQIVYVNPSGATMLKAEQSGMFGKPIGDYVVGNSDPKTLIQNLMQAVKEEGKYQTEFSGPYGVSSLNVSVADDSEGQPAYLVASMRDITKQRDYERQLLTLHQLTTELVQIRDTDQLLETVLRFSEDLLRANACAIYLIDSKTLQITNTLVHNLDPQYVQRIARDYRGLPGDDARKTLQPVSVRDILDSEIYGERIHFMADFNIRALIVLPIIFQESPFGALTLYYHQTHQFSDQEIQIGNILVQTLAIVMKNAQLYQDERDQRKFAEALAQAATAVNSSLEISVVLDQILEQTMRVVPCRAANIMTIKNNKISLTRHRGYEDFTSDVDELREMGFSIEWHNLKEMYRSGQPISIPDTTLDESWQFIHPNEWIRSYVGIPLHTGQQVIGFLNLDSDQPHAFTTKHIQQLQTFADYASTAIKNARAYEESRQRAEEMAALVTAASAVSKSLEFKEVLKIIAEHMTRVLKVKTCAISDYDAQKKQVRLLISCTAGNWKTDPKWYQPYDLNIYPLTRQVLENNEPMYLHLDEPDLDQAERKFMEEVAAETMLMLPLVSQDRVIGLVELMDTDKERVFSVREVALGLSLASHAASAIENAALYQQLQEYASDLEQRVAQRTRQLQTATESIESILASVPDAIFVLDQKHALLRSNQAGEKLISQAQASNLDLFDPKLLQDIENGHPPQAPAVLQIHNQAYQVLSSQLPSGESQTGGQILLFRDVTHFQELDQMKNQFVSDVSHELRTPLTNLTLYLGLLTTVQDPHKQSDYILTLQRETERLTFLIEDLLTISRLEAGRVQLQIRATDINHLIESLVHDRSFLAAQKNISLDFSPTEKLPRAAADSSLLTQALSNLLTNAINYTLSGGEIKICTALPEPTWVTIQIADTGVGILPEETERIFERFYRGQASQHTGAEGTGLGLSISREIVQRLGGKITFQSAPGQGSTFTIWLKTASSDML